MTFVTGGRRVGGNLSDFLHHKNFSLNFTKSPAELFFSEFSAFL